jgi:hypothetical protein
VSLTLERPEQRSKQRQLVAWLLGLALAVGVLTPLMHGLDDLPRADVTFVNRSKWDVSVDLLLDNGASRVGLATIRAHSAMKIEEIGAPGGDTWIFEFDAGDQTTRVSVPNETVRANHARVAVPRALTDQLEAIDAPPSPYA